MYFCCKQMGGWHQLVCLLDNLNHGLARLGRARRYGRISDRVCDIHDRLLIGDMDED